MFTQRLLFMFFVRKEVITFLDKCVCWTSAELVLSAKQYIIFQYSRVLENHPKGTTVLLTIQFFNDEYRSGFPGSL